MWTDENAKPTSSAMLHCCAAFLMSLGPGTAAGFYMAMSGFYIQQFGERSFFITMLFCFCASAPIVSLLQGLFDGHFDEAFSTRVTFSFRVFSMQLILGTIVVAWMFCTTGMSVLLIGVLLGFASFSIISSSLQMVAATDPTHIIYTSLGLQAGGVLPLIVFGLSGFNPSSSYQEFQFVVSTSVFVSVFAACLLGYLDKTTEIFTKAYERLAYDQTPIPLEDGEDKGLLAGRYTSESQVMEPDVAKYGIPSWVAYWQSCGGLSAAIIFCSVSLAGYFGDANVAQTLSLLKMLMEFIGRMFAWVVPFAPSFKQGPWHKTVAGSMIAMVCLFGLCMANLFGIHLGHGLFLVSWCSLFAIGVFIMSLVDVTAGSYVSVGDRKAVARGSQTLRVSGMLVGIIAAQVLGKALSHPPMLPAPS